MARMLIILAMSATMLFSFSENASGVGRRRWSNLRIFLFRQPHHELRQYDRQRYDHHRNPYDYYNDLYPKFYGGFHSRHYTTYGYPSGDIGLRGLPW